MEHHAERDSPTIRSSGCAARRLPDSVPRIRAGYAGPGCDLGGLPAQFFLEYAGVAMTDGSLCEDAGRGFVRYSFATPRPIMIRTLEQMDAAPAKR